MGMMLVGWGVLIRVPRDVGEFIITPGHDLDASGTELSRLCATVLW